VPRLSLDTPLIPTVRGIGDCLRLAIERDSFQQSIAERLTKAMVVAGLLWVAIWWALS
jgi:hypothetical protein